MDGRIYVSDRKVRKRAKIRNRYNQSPHLTQDTSGKVTTSQLDITNESQEVSPFPAGDHKASINIRTRKHNKNKTEITNDPRHKSISCGSLRFREDFLSFSHYTSIYARVPIQSAQINTCIFSLPYLMMRYT